MNDNLVPFPQANDLKKVISVINVKQPDKLKDYQYMTLQLDGISERQVDYYITACAYLGLITKNKKFTELGCRLREKKGEDQIAELSRIIMSDEVFGYVYFKQKFRGKALSKIEVIETMRELVYFNSEQMYERRASTIISWLKWIKEKEKY